MPTTIRSLLFALALGVPAVAGAHPHPRFWVMDDLTSGGHAGLDIILGEVDTPDTELILFEPHVALGIGHNFKLQLGLPLGLAFYDARPAGDENESTGLIGNLFIGGQFLSSSGVHGAGMTTFGGGVSYSGLTASDEGEEAIGAVNAASFSQLRDFGKYLPNTDTLRLHGDIRYTTPGIFFQGELGLHIHFFDVPEPQDDDLTVLRIGLGIGFYVTPALALQAELTFTSTLDNDDDDDLYAVIDVGARHDVGDTSFGVRLIAPLDDGGAAEHIGVGVDLLQRF